VDRRSRLDGARLSVSASASAASVVHSD